VLAINHDLRRSPPAMPPNVEAVTHEDVPVTVDLPEGFRVASVGLVEGDQVRELREIEQEDGQLSITLPEVEATKMLKIQLEKAAG